ncbi:MAG: T9SS type A sorting domain-containing protein [Ignavibacteriales bacterium]|nr:T9SS type A sorting domain-containing protein [Ignavibacteriales bacterium]
MKRTVFLLGLLMFVNSRAVTYHVPAQFVKIQAAINAVANYDTIIIGKGIYFETLTLNRPVTLIGEDRDSVIITMLTQWGIPPINEPIIRISGAEILLKNLTVKISRPPYGVHDGVGIMFYGATNSKLLDVIVKEFNYPPSYPTPGANGIEIYKSTHLSMVNIQAKGGAGGFQSLGHYGTEYAKAGYGIYFDSNSSCTVNNSLISTNYLGKDMGLKNGSFVEFFSSTGTLTYDCDSTSTISFVNAISEQPATENKEFILMRNFPNPFNPTTQVAYFLLQKEFISLKVFNILGREVRTLIEGENSAGEHSVTFNSSGLPCGMYICRLTTKSLSKSIKMLLLK